MFEVCKKKKTIAVAESKVKFWNYENSSKNHKSSKPPAEENKSERNPINDYFLVFLFFFMRGHSEQFPNEINWSIC